MNRNESQPFMWINQTVDMILSPFSSSSGTKVRMAHLNHHFMAIIQILLGNVSHTNDKTVGMNRTIFH